jgi:hypothetical protein
MSNRRRRKLDQTVATVQQRYGPQALRRGVDGVHDRSSPHIATGFAELDARTGCGGVPRGALTLLTGPTTSGKLTLAYKTLAGAQEKPTATIALIDLAHHTDPDYLQRCGIDLNRLLLIRPDAATDLGALLLDLTRDQRIHAVLLDSLVEAAFERTRWRQLLQTLGPAASHLRRNQGALLCIDDLNPPWLRWLNLDRTAAVRQHAALHLRFRRERWLRREGELVGYRAQVQIVKSRWRRDQPTARIEIHFNGAVRARENW